jgi:hypothetical protein
MENDDRAMDWRQWVRLMFTHLSACDIAKYSDSELRRIVAVAADEHTEKFSAVPHLVSALKDAVESLVYVDSVAPVLSGYGVRSYVIGRAKAAIAEAEGKK